MPKVLKIDNTDNDLCLYLTVDEAPYTICKVVKFLPSNNTMEDFKAKPVNYIKKQVPGFRIFLIHAGFLDKPAEHISDDVIEAQVDLMIDWYLKNKTINKEGRTIKKFLITH